MTKQEKAKVLLEYLDEYVNIDWNFEEYYLKAIIKGLREVEKREEGRL